MKIAVCLKQVFDTEAKIQLTADGKINTSGVNLIVNPYDEFAIEEALRIKEKNGAGEVIIVSLGSATPEAIRQALAMGADRAVSLEDAAFAGDAHTAAVAIAAALKEIQPDLILGGWVAIDDNGTQVMTRVAEILGLPQVNVVTKLTIACDKAVAERQGEGTTEVIEVPLPAVITCQKGINEVRYPSLKGIMAAKKKELKVTAAKDLGLDAASLAACTQVTSYALPQARKAGKVLEGEPADTARELVRLLREEAKVI